MLDKPSKQRKLEAPPATTREAMQAKVACNAARATNKMEVEIFEAVTAEEEKRRQAKERSEVLDQKAPMSRPMTTMMQAKTEETEEATRKRNAQKGDASSVADQLWHIDLAARDAISATISVIKGDMWIVRRRSRVSARAARE